MIQEYSKWRILQKFFDDPNPQEGFTVRGIAKEVKLAPTSVRLHLDRLTKEGLVTRSQGRTFPVFWPQRDSDRFRFLKRMDILFRLEEGGVLEYIEEKSSPHAIVLFGSACRGEDVKTSDIDLFVDAHEQPMDLTPFEKNLKRQVSIHWGPLNKMPKELRNNILNGIRLRGYVRVFV